MNLNISREQMRAFLALVRKKTFSSAAQTLNITQAAFSIRIQRLEEELQRTLLVRNKTGIQLTDAGKTFFSYCELAEELEEEFLADFSQEGERLKGTLSIGAFSSIGRSLVLPALDRLLRENPDVALSYTVKELGELPGLLLSAEADFIFLDRPLKKEGVESLLLGKEDYVHITSVHQSSNQDIFLNHDELDLMSFRYFDHIGSPVKELKRRYLDEIYSVIDGVARGWGVSVLPEHLIRNDDRIKVVNPRKRLQSPVYLCFRKRSFYSRTFKEALEVLKREIPKGLR